MNFLSLSLSRKIAIFPMLFLLLSALVPARAAQAAAAEPQPARLVSPAGLLKADGSLKLDGSFRGGLDLSGWSVQMDAQRGPVLGLQPENTTGQWNKLGASGGTLSNSVYTITINGSDVFLGGAFTNANGLPAADDIVKWDSVSDTWSALGSASSGNGSLNGGVDAILVKGSDVYVGGTFDNVKDGATVLTAADYIAKWDGSHWSALSDNGSSNGSLNSPVNVMASVGSDIYVGGEFTDVYDGSNGLWAADYLTRWDGTHWYAVGNNGAGNGSLNNSVHALAVSGTDLYVGGGFTDVKNGLTPLTAADRIAKWDTLGGTWSALGSGAAGDGALSSTVMAIAISGANIYAGGGFTNVNNAGTPLPAADYIARFDGANWNAVGSGTNGNGALNNWVESLVVSGTTVYAGGYFSLVNNRGMSLLSTSYVAEWNGSNWGPVGNFAASIPSLSAEVFGLAVAGSSLYAGGNFVNVNNDGVAIPAADMAASFGLIADTTPPVVQSITRAGANPTFAASVGFTVTFSKPVSGVDTTDFVLSANGVTGASVTSVSGSGASYTVTVDTGTAGMGTLRLDLVDDDTIMDWAANSLGGSGLGNGSFAAGEAYTVRQYQMFLPAASRA